MAQVCESLYQALTDAGIEVLFMDEAKARLGAMLADAELMGLPHRLVVGDRGLEEGVVEYKGAAGRPRAKNIPLADVVATLKSRMSL